MPIRGYTGPQWIKTVGDPAGLFQKGATGVYYLRRNYSPGPGEKPRAIARSLGTKSKKEALKRFDIVARELRLIIEKERRPSPSRHKPSLKENVEYWRKALAEGGEQAEASWDHTIETMLGAEIGSEFDHKGYEWPIYDAKREEQALTLTNLVYGTATPIDFYVDDFVNHQPRSIRYQSLIRLAVRQLVEFLAERPGTKDIKAITRKAASEFVSHLQKSNGSIRTAKAKRSALSCYWTWLVEREDAEENVWERIRMAKTPTKTDVRPFTEAEMRLLLNGGAPKGILDFIKIAALTGMRQSEIGNLRVRDCVDGWFKIRKGKNDNSPRTPPIHSTLAPIIEERSRGKGPSDFLFYDLPKSEGKGRQRAEKAGQFFTKYRRDLGIIDNRDDGRTRVDFHSFRRWFVTEALRHSGYPEYVVSQIVGHAEGKAGTTVGVYYGGPLEWQLKEVMESVRLPT